MGNRRSRPQATEADRARWRALFRQPQLLPGEPKETDPTARPRPRKRAPLQVERELTPFERELLAAPCPRHSSLAVCDSCTPLGARDSTGFPGAMHAAGRGRYRGCPACGKLYLISEWSFLARSCQGCAGAEVSGATTLVAKPASSLRGPENHRRR